MNSCVMCSVYKDEEGDLICLETIQQYEKSVLEALECDESGLKGCSSIHLNEEDDVICLETNQRFEEGIEEDFAFISAYDDQQIHSPHWRVSDFEDNFDVINLESDSDCVSVNLIQSEETSKNDAPGNDENPPCPDMNSSDEDRCSEGIV